MPNSTFALILTCILGSYAIWDAHSPSQKRKRTRKMLPQNLGTWRLPEDIDDEEKTWALLDNVFANGGLTLWKSNFDSNLVHPVDVPILASGFGYVTATREAVKGPGTVKKLGQFNYRNSLQRAAATRDGHSVIVRVVVVGDEGKEHLEILRKIATGRESFLSNNHTLPMFSEFRFADITFGIFPKVGAEVVDAYDLWPRNSVGDIVDMIMQMLEALEFIHSLKIAHRDAFHDNFVVQWHPESLVSMKIASNHPRVYLIDFETAIQFPAEYSTNQCTVSGFPLAGSVTKVELYSRPYAPEFNSDKAYSPFKLDIWQLGRALANFKSTIPAVDDILASMTQDDPEKRMNATETLGCFEKVIRSMAPEMLLVQPIVTNDP